MIARQNHALHIVFSVSLLLANIVCFNVLFGRVRGARVDLTEGKIYTLAPQTRELLQEPEEPLEIFFYHTALDRLHEKLRPLVGPLSDILKEFAAASNDKVTARIVEWDTADKATQDRASEQFGVKGVGIQMQTSDEETVRNTYFSVVVAYGDQFQRFDQADLYRIVQVGAGLDIRVELQNIEYLLAKAIYKVVRGFQSIGAALATHGIEGRIDLYFSPADQLPEFLKKVPGYATKVAKKLSDEAMGRLKFETHEVADADDALKKKLRTEFGLRAIQTDLFSEKGIYSYAVITAGKQIAPVPLVTLGEEMSEFEVRDAIEGALKSLVPGFLMTIGVMSPDAGKNQMAQMMGQRAPPEEFREVVQALEAEFDVRRIDITDGKPIPRQIAVLVLIRPENYSDKTIYEIDQFLMRGGRLVVCADAMSLDLEQALQLRQQNTLKRVDIGAFKPFLRHMGADVGDGAILDMKSEVVRMMEQVGRRGEIRFFDLKLPYFVYVEAPDGFDQTHDIVAKQRFLLLEWATHVSAAKAQPAGEDKEAQPGVPAGVTAREIAWTSKESSISKDVAQAKAQMTAGFEYTPPPDAQRYPVVLVLNGVFPSYFAGKPIPGTDKGAAESKGTDTAASRPSEDRERGVRLDKSKETSIVVIGDSDFVSPVVAQWFGVEKSLSRNVAFLRNAIDFGGPEAKLMAIRNRENVQRPLTMLRSLDEEQRQARTAMSRWLALVVPCGFLLIFGTVWAVMRHNRRPLELPAGRHSTSRVTS